MPTPLPDIDQAQVTAFWRRFRATGIAADLPSDPPVAEHFGDSVELADELIDLVLHGPKRATAGAMVDFEREQQPLPQVGDFWIAVDGRGRPRAVLRTTEVPRRIQSGPPATAAWDGKRPREAAHE